MVDVIKLGIKRPVTNPLLPDPEPRQVKYTLISADDHLMEPPHTFEGRLPAKLQDRAPRIVETDEGHQVWSIEGNQSDSVTKVKVPMTEVVGYISPFRLSPGERVSRFSAAADIE